MFNKFEASSHKVKCLVYGAAGSGKTRFAATAPKPVFLSAEGGLLSALAVNKNVQFADVKSLKDLREAYKILSKGGHGFETVVIDSISEINEIIKSEIEGKKGRPMQLQDWGELSKEIRRLFRAFRDLDMHVILISQEQPEKDDQTVLKMVPMLNGKAATEVAYFMDIVGYLFVDKAGEHRITTSPDTRLLTKDRTGMIGKDAPCDFSEWVACVAKMEITPVEKPKAKSTTKVKMGKPNKTTKKKMGKDSETTKSNTEKPSEQVEVSPSKENVVKSPSGEYITKDQIEEVVSLWDRYSVFEAVENPKDVFKATLYKRFKVRDVTSLTSDQASDLIKKLTAKLPEEVAKAEPKEKDLADQAADLFGTEAEVIPNTEKK